MALQVRSEMLAVNVRDCEEKVGGGAGFAVAMAAMVHADVSRRGGRRRRALCGNEKAWEAMRNVREEEVRLCMTDELDLNPDNHVF
jgi:hypothetical protein